MRLRTRIWPPEAAAQTLATLGAAKTPIQNRPISARKLRRQDPRLIPFVVAHLLEVTVMSVLVVIVATVMATT